MPSSPPITDPRSRHNIHVTARSDLHDVGPWSTDVLYAAVVAADRADGEQAAVLDYGRENIYVAGVDSLTYHPPETLGFESPPTLAVTDPQLYDPDEPALLASESVEISPEFDILIPAFDWEELSEEDLLPPVDKRPSESPTGSETPG